MLHRKKAGQLSLAVADVRALATFEFTGLRDFSPRSGGMMGWSHERSHT